MVARTRGIPASKALDAKIARLAKYHHWTRYPEQQMERARKRLGATPVEQLQWLLGFLREDLGVLRPTELTNRGDDLRELAVLALHAAKGGYAMPTDDMAPATLRAYQRAIRDGIDNLLAEKGPGEWTIPATPRVVALEDGGFVIQFYGDEAAGILGGVAHLIVQVGDRLRACLECGAPFVATSRQARYCTPQHSQKARNKRRPEKEA